MKAPLFKAELGAADGCPVMEWVLWAVTVQTSSDGQQDPDGAARRIAPEVGAGGFGSGSVLGPAGHGEENKMEPHNGRLSRWMVLDAA